MIRILLVCGSQRAGSLNALLLRGLATALPDTVQADFLRAEDVDLPLYHGDLESDPALRTRLRRVHARFCDADALILASPEFNGAMTPFLKNLIDWVSRLPYLDGTAANAFADKPVLLAGASPGWSGGAVGIPALRAVMGHVGGLVFGETITVPYADRALAADGTPDPAFAGTWWRDCVGRFAALAATLKG